MKIIFFGTPYFVVPLLETLHEHYTVAAVVTTPDQKVGRKQILTPSAVKVYAEQHNIPVLQPDKLTDFSLSDIEKLQTDLFIVAAYGKIIPQALLKIPKHGAINIHPSLLPKYRGPTPVQSALKDSVTDSGITFILMDEKMDHGPILHQVPFSFSSNDTSETLLDTLFAKSASVLPEIIDAFTQGKIKPQPQNESDATYCKILTKEDGYIQLDTPPSKEEFDAMVRAFYPWPNVWTKVKINGKEVRIKFLPNQTIQMEGKQPVTLKDFINGYPLLKERIVSLYQ